MKTLKESILSRSSHTGEKFKAQRREMIESWLKEHNITYYTINDDFTIDVNGEVFLFKSNLIQFPEYIQFGVVKGDFDCRNNILTSLRGCPREVEGGFYCNVNELTSLEGAPEKVGGNFYCNHNKLTSLEGASKKVGGFFDCSDNQLTSLKGVPKEVGRDFTCSDNRLTSLEGAPEKVGGDFACFNCIDLISLKGAPKKVGGDFYCKRGSIQFTKEDVKKVCNVKGEIFV